MKIKEIKTLWKARYRLYQRRFSQPITHFAAIFREIQDSKTFAQFQTQTFANFDNRFLKFLLENMFDFHDNRKIFNFHMGKSSIFTEPPYPAEGRAVGSPQVLFDLQEQAMVGGDTRERRRDFSGRIQFCSTRSGRREARKRLESALRGVNFGRLSVYWRPTISISWAKTSKDAQS